MCGRHDDAVWYWTFDNCPNCNWLWTKKKKLSCPFLEKTSNTHRQISIFTWYPSGEIFCCCFLVASKRFLLEINDPSLNHSVSLGDPGWAISSLLFTRFTTSPWTTRIHRFVFFVFPVITKITATDLQQLFQIKLDAHKASIFQYTCMYNDFEILSF